MSDFPSVEFFRVLQRSMNDNPDKFRALGFTDSRAVFAVRADDELKSDRYFGAVFEVYDCTEICELEAGEVEGFDPDWILEADCADWREMIANIRAEGAADSDHTLNRLSLLGHPFRIHGADQTRVDVFHRQQLSYQEFFDQASEG